MIAGFPRFAFRACSTDWDLAIFAGSAREKIYGREIPLAMTNGGESVAPVKWLRKILRAKAVSAEFLEAQVLPRIPEFTNGGRLSELVRRNDDDFGAH